MRLRPSSSPILRLAIVPIVLGFLGLLAMAACSKPTGQLAAGGAGGAPGGAGAGRGPVEFPVEVEAVESRTVEYTVSAVGSVEAFETVEVTARVAGVIEQVRFAEGNQVASGQSLVDIEPQRYQLAVDSARASLERSEASRADAEAGLRRRETVNAQNPNLVRAEDVDAYRTRLRVATAEVAEKRAALDLAELNLRDARVRAPKAGIIQTRTVQTGQYVQPGTVLATLLRREPLLLRFKVPELEAAPLTAGIEARFQVRGESTVYVAKLTSVGESADAATRMVDVAAEVTDTKRAALRPGTFAQVTVPVGSRPNSPVVPQTAVRPSERGFLAFVVEDGMAKERVLTLGLRTADGRVEVRAGILPGERLVVRGAEALRDGAKVKVAGEAPVKPAP